MAMTTLGFERDHSGGGGNSVGGSFRHVLSLARWLDRTHEPAVRQQLANSYIRQRVVQYTNRRAVAGIKAGEVPGPEASLGKLMWTDGMRHTTEVVSPLRLMPRSKARARPAVTSRRGAGHTNRAGLAGAAQAAISGWVFVKVLLVIILGVEELIYWLNLGGDCAVAGFGQHRRKHIA